MPSPSSGLRSFTSIFSLRPAHASRLLSLCYCVVVANSLEGHFDSLACELTAHPVSDNVLEQLHGLVNILVGYAFILELADHVERLTQVFLVLLLELLGVSDAVEELLISLCDLLLFLRVSDSVGNLRSECFYEKDCGIFTACPTRDEARTAGVTAKEVCDLLLSPLYPSNWPS